MKRFILFVHIQCWKINWLFLNTRLICSVARDKQNAILYFVNDSQPECAMLRWKQNYQQINFCPHMCGWRKSTATCTLSAAPSHHRHVATPVLRCLDDMLCAVCTIFPVGAFLWYDSHAVVPGHPHTGWPNDAFVDFSSSWCHLTCANPARWCYWLSAQIC